MNKNGNKEHEEITFKKNVDFFEFKDGVYYTVEALCKKYDCVNSHIYRRANENNIPKEVVIGTSVYKDSEHFAKKPKANNLLGHTPLSSYAELHRSVELMIDSIRSQHAMQNDWNSHISSEFSKVNDGYMLNMDRLNRTIDRFNDTLKENNRLLNEILNYITIPKENTNANDGK